MGGHKGSGLALACELLAGALTGNGTNGPAEHPFGNGLFAVLVDPAHLGDAEGFAAEVDAYVGYMRASTPASGAKRVMIPGGPERACRRERLAHGLSVPAPVLDAILAIARQKSLDASRQGLAMGIPRAGATLWTWERASA